MIKKELQLVMGKAIKMIACEIYDYMDPSNTRASYNHDYNELTAGKLT